MSWHREQPLLALDFESTGVDTETARIVTATLIDIQPGYEPAGYSWLINPGVPIPDEAAAIHGVTTEIAEANGVTPTQALGEIRSLLRQLWSPSVPLIAFNVVYDATLLDRELRRHGWVDGLAFSGPAVDPMVIDRALYPFRQGKRTLTATCEHYKIELVDAHTSAADAIAAARLAWKIADQHPQIGGAALAELHTLQTEWYAYQQKDFAEWLRKQAAKEKDEAKREETIARADAITGHWPIQPHPDLARSA